MVASKIKRIVIGIYVDTDFYPPTINAIINLAPKCDELVVVTRNNTTYNIPFPANVKQVKTGNYIDLRESERKSVVHKILSFLRFSFQLYRYFSSSKTELLILYDVFPLFSFYLLRFFPRKANLKIWYHNHDMPNFHLLRKYSIGWLAGKYEKKAMKFIDLFSLPSEDRLCHYPNWDKKENFLYIPNFPSLNVYTKASEKNLDQNIRLIFQGSIGEGHSLENTIELLNETISGFSLSLILKGAVRNDYKKKLDKLALDLGVTDKLFWIGVGPYMELPILTSSCHIGLAIHLGTDDVSKTLGTASNKIYEYAASGLPVILFDNEQFKKHLSHYKWALFTDGSKASIKSLIEEVIQNYLQVSRAARKDFEDELNFEVHFKMALKKLNDEYSQSL